MNFSPNEETQNCRACGAVSNVSGQLQLGRCGDCIEQSLEMVADSIAAIAEMQSSLTSIQNSLDKLAACVVNDDGVTYLRTKIAK